MEIGIEIEIDIEIVMEIEIMMEKDQDLRPQFLNNTSSL